MLPGWKELYCAVWRWLFHAGLAALESISPGKSIHYGIGRYRMSPSKENIPRQQPASQFLEQIHPSPV